MMPKVFRTSLDLIVIQKWLFYFVFFSFLVDQFEAFVACEFTYGYETDEFTLAFINLTYVDSETGKVYTEKEEAGKYSVGKVEPVSGIVVHATSNNHTSFDACDPLDTDIFPSEPWIALVRYGNCRDSTKLRNVANTNASAVVVYSNQPGTKLIKLHHRDELVYLEQQDFRCLSCISKVFRIIAVFITKEKGEEISTLLDNGTKVMMYITVGTHNTFRYGNINRTSVLFVSISFVILMIISLAWLVFYYIQRFRYIHAKDLLAKRLCSAAKKALDKIPVKTLKSGDSEVDIDCAVCIEPLKTNETVRTLPCRHTFHKSCVDPWLLDQRSCPMCKMDILMYYGLVFSGSQESVLNIYDNDAQNSPNDDMDDDFLAIPSSQPSSPINSQMFVENHPAIPLNPEVTIIEGTLISPLHTTLPTDSDSPSSAISNSARQEPLTVQQQFNRDWCSNEDVLSLPISPLASVAPSQKCNNNSTDPLFPSSVSTPSKNE